MTDSETPAGGRIELLIEQGIGWIVIDNQLRRNAISGAMFQAITDAVTAFEADDEVRVVIFRGAGGRAFSAGADLKDVGGGRNNFEQAFTGALKTVAGCVKPTIAMLQGFWIGGGAALAMCCDIRLAADDSVFALTPAKLGLAFDYGSTKRLVDLVGPAYAKEILMTARQFSAEECLGMGVVNKVIHKPDLDLAVADLARQIAGNAPLSVTAMKLTVNAVVRDTPGKDVSEVHAAVMAANKSDDAAEAIRAFQEKRPPRFTGR